VLERRLGMDTVVIEANKGEAHYWHEVWRFRELFQVLARRDITVRYKQTLIGITWTLIQPLATILVFTVIFGRVAKMPSDGVPYPLLVFAGALPWQFFSAALSNSSQSLVLNSALISKVYFPRLIVPASTIFTALFDFLVSLALMGIAMAFLRYPPGWQIFTLPLFIFWAALCVLGPGLLITALNVRYRDFRYIVGFAIQFGVFVSPVGFTSSIVPEHWRILYSLNPMVGVIDGFRWSLLGIPLHWETLVTSGIVTLILLYVGLRFFRRTESTFADII